MLFPFFLTVGLTVGAKAAVPALTVQETIQLALKKSLVVESSKRQLTIAELEYSNSWSRFLPSLDLDASGGLQKALSGNHLQNTTDPFVSRGSLTLSEVLYDNGESLTKFTTARLKKELARLTFLRDRDKMILDLLTKFYIFSLNSRLVDAKKEQLTILEKMYQSATVQYKQGLKTKNDFLRFKIQVQRAEIDLLAAKTAAETSEIAIREIANAKEDIKFKPIEPQQLKSENGSLTLDIEKTYEYQRRRVQEKINSEAVKLVERKYWPQVTLTSSVYYTNSQFINSNLPFDANHQTGWNTLVTLSFNLWDWGIRSRDIEVAQQQNLILNNQSSLVVLATQTEISTLTEDLKRLKAYLISNKELLAAEDESHRRLNEQYREGKLGYLDFITSVQNLLDAKIRFFSSQFDFATAEAKYRFYEGTLYEKVISP